MKSISKKRLAIIGTVGVPTNYGGFETLVEHIVEPLSKIYDVTVFGFNLTQKNLIYLSNGIAQRFSNKKEKERNNVQININKRQKKK